MLNIAFNIKRIAGKEQVDASSDINRIYREVALLLVKPGSREQIENIGILNLLRLCYNAEEEIINDEKFIKDALDEDKVHALVKNKFARFRMVMNTEGALKREMEAEKGYVGALAKRIGRQNQLLALLKSKLEEEFQLREKDAKKLMLIIRKPEPRAGKDSRPIIVLDEETEFEAEAVGPEDKRELVQSINSGQNPNLRFKWVISQKSKVPFELETEKRGVRSGKVIMPSSEFNINNKAYLEVGLYDIRNNEIIAKSAQTEVKLVKRDRNEEVFKRLEAIGKRIYGEIEKYNKTKEDGNLSDTYDLRSWLDYYYSQVSFMPDFDDDTGKWSRIGLHEGKLGSDLKDKLPVMIVPQLEVRLDHKRMKQYFDNYKKGMVLKPDDVLKFARGFAVWGKKAYERTDLRGMKHIERDKEFKLLEKGIIRLPEKVRSLREIIEGEEEALKILEKILKEKYPRAYKFIDGNKKALLKLYSQVKSMDREKITGAIGEKRNEIAERIERDSETSHENMIRLIAWLRELAKRLEERERKRAMEPPTKSRLNRYGEKLLDIQLRRAGPPIETPESEERKIKSRIQLILELADRLEKLEEKRVLMMGATIGAIAVMEKPSMRINLLGKGPQIMPTGRPSVPKKLEPTEVPEPTAAEEKEAIDRISESLDEI
ncbi:hypothetical protein HYX06_02260 [Candidatus Woesearchaeota archaeon]|nr:hypothetical protein [Candidatus Woesearchaeota archaeon]